MKIHVSSYVGKFCLVRKPSRRERVILCIDPSQWRPKPVGAPPIIISEVISLRPSILPSASRK